MAGLLGLACRLGSRAALAAPGCRSALPAPRPLLGAGRRGLAVWGFPPQKATKQYTGIHCEPGRVFGYKNPIKRQGKVRRLPNVRPTPDDYTLGPAANGQFYWRPPYPPRANRTIEVLPPWGARKNPWPTKTHKSYALRWGSVEYVHVPQLARKPHGHPTRRWAGPVTRIEHAGAGRSEASLVSHDVRLLP